MIYAVVGTNSTSVLENLGGLTWVAVARIFGPGTIAYTSTILRGTKLPKMASLALFSAYKNVGLATAVAS